MLGAMTELRELVLVGRRVRLEPLTPEHVPPLTALALARPEEYRLTSTPASPVQAGAYFGRALADLARGTAYVAAVVDLRDGRLLGSSRLTDIDRQHLRCELGYTWYDPAAFRTGVNTDCKLLLLGLAFDTLGLHRVQIHTDTRNLRSQAAIRSLGARYEGVLRRHMVAKDGHVRDTMVFAVTDEDWPEVQRALRARLGLNGSRAGSPPAPADR